MLVRQRRTLVVFVRQRRTLVVLVRQCRTLAARVPTLGLVSICATLLWAQAPGRYVNSTNRTALIRVLTGNRASFHVPRTIY